MNPGQGWFNTWPTASIPACGTAAAPPNDVRICGGHLVESVSDHGGQSTLAMYPKQPFDIAGRTGTAVFDVSADSAGPHAAWPEFWWTDQPVPAPHADLPSQFPYARNSFGFSLASDQCPAGQTSIYQFFTTTNYVPATFGPSTPDGCVVKGTSSALNHFEVRASANRVEVWGSDPGGAVKLLAHFDGTLPLSRGVIWIEDVHYNACKDGATTQCDHAFTWDNVGFDGPRPYTDLTFDVPDNTTAAAQGTNLGYRVDPGATVNLTPTPVSWQQTPTTVYVGLNWWPEQAAVPSVSVNGGAFQTIPWPGGETFGWRTVAIPVPFSDVHAGANTIAVRWSGSTTTAISNVNLILIAAAP